VVLTNSRSVEQSFAGLRHADHSKRFRVISVNVGEIR
jgi:hypothetical protein